MSTRAARCRTTGPAWLGASALTHSSNDATCLMNLQPSNIPQTHLIRLTFGWVFVPVAKVDRDGVWSGTVSSALLVSSSGLIGALVAGCCLAYAAFGV